MREIEFRAWDKTSNEFVQLTNLFVNLGSGIIFENYRDGFEGVDNLKSLSKFEIMQFTGLIDKNGVKVFDGDILECYCYEEVIQISWDESGARWRFDKIDRFDHGYGIGTSDFTRGIAIDSKVIGNIYQNPELAPIK